MNILYIEHYAGSPDMGMEFRPYYLSREWVKMGHKVTIIAGDYSHLRKKNPNVDNDWKTEEIDGIEYVWLKTGKYEGNGAARAFTMERFVRKIWTHSSMIAKKWNPDVVIASSTYPLDAYPARSIAKKAGAKYIHEVHDMWPATLYEVGGMSRNHPFVMIMQMAEDYAYRNCDKCVSLLPYSKSYMVEHGLDKNKYANVQNGIVEEEWSNPEPLPSEYDEFFENHKENFIVGYFGGHALSNALDKVLDTAKGIRSIDKKVVFVLVGDGTEKNRLIERSKAEMLDNVFFLKSVNKKAVPNLLKYFNCSILTGLPSPLYRFGLSPNKMYDSMMAGIPIICAFDAPETLVVKYECGIQCNPDIAENIVNSILSIKKLSKDERIQMGYNGQKAILEHFTYSKLAEKFIGCLNN